MDQQWINDVLLALPLPPLASPDDLLLELAPPPLGKRDRERQTETHKRKAFVTIDQGSDLMWNLNPLFGEIEHVKKHSKIPRNALFDALLKSSFQKIAVGTAKKNRAMRRFW